MLQELMRDSDLDDDDWDVPNSQQANNLDKGVVQSKVMHCTVSKGVLINNAGPAAALGETLGDSVHRALRLHPACTAFMNTLEFSRLASLRQLGAAYHFFPAAVHTRREHSIGVSHLAWEMIRGLLERSKGALDVTAEEVRNVALAGLCHDLGHGPLSHVFEKEFIRRLKPMREWTHEQMSIDILRLMCERGTIPDFKESDIAFMEGLIRGLKSNQRDAVPPAKRFLYDIISNDHNGIDVDRMDYLQRDAQLTGAGPLACDVRQLLDTAEVVEGEICYPLSQADNVWSVFTERVRMFRDVYTHRRTKAAEFMVAEALAAADAALQFSRLVREAKDFVHLDDSLLAHIENFHIFNPAAFDALGGQVRGQLVRAQELLGRLRRRELYPCAGVCEVPAEKLLDGSWEDAKDALVHRFTPEHLLRDLPPAAPTAAAAGDAAAPGAAGAAAAGAAAASTSISAEDLILDVNRINYANGGQDPMATVGFFDEAAPLSAADGTRTKRRLTQPEMSRLANRPRCFKIRTLRVFVRQADHCAAAAAAFRAWCEAHLGPEAVVRTGLEVEETAAAAAAAAALPLPPPRPPLRTANGAIGAAAAPERRGAGADGEGCGPDAAAGGDAARQDTMEPDAIATPPAPARKSKRRRRPELP